MGKGLGVLAWMLVVVALAQPPERGWSAGQPAAGAADWIRGPAEAPLITLPKNLRAQITTKTFLFYFSPTCPHCQHVAPEVVALADRLKGQAAVLGISSASGTPKDLEAFKSTYQVTFPVLFDGDREIGAALAARSTPSALLVEPAAGQQVRVLDLWYPYAGGMDALVLGRLAGEPFAAYRPGEYQGNRACAACHTVETASWTLTHHAIAWRTLVLQEEHTNAECVGCHVTGKDQPTGWAGDPHSPLVDVGCEACHGPGGPHDGTREDPTLGCAGCHDAKHSIAFSVAKGLPALDHYQAAHLTETERRRRVEALLGGEAPRTLLAFPEGPHVGPAACQGCHPAEYAQWASSRHAFAQTTLTLTQEQGQLDCVRCHATPIQSGSPPQTLDGFRPGEGVSCESCHGPGSAHVAAGGGKDNIQGLGESCPVCVLEAVCTTCHTRRWSPDWDLETYLQRSAHGAKPTAPSPANLP